MTGYSNPRPIRADDEVSEFRCGSVDLDDYLRRRALRNHEAGASRCFVTTSAGTVAGYYALATATIYHLDLPGRFRRNMPDPIPAVLLSRLAVDEKHGGTGVGRSLLRDAIARTVRVADEVGVRAMLVHALDASARDFYLRHDFELSPTDDLHLLLLVKDARALLA